MAGLQSLFQWLRGKLVRRGVGTLLILLLSERSQIISGLIQGVLGREQVRKNTSFLETNSYPRSGIGNQLQPDYNTYNLWPLAMLAELMVVDGSWCLTAFRGPWVPHPCPSSYQLTVPGLNYELGSSSNMLEKSMGRIWRVASNGITIYSLRLIAPG